LLHANWESATWRTVCNSWTAWTAQVQLLTNPSGIASYYDFSRDEYYISTSNYQGLSFGTKLALLGDIFDAGEGL
jgi:hypothetical protein